PSEHHRKRRHVPERVRRPGRRGVRDVTGLEVEIEEERTVMEALQPSDRLEDGIVIIDLAGSLGTGHEIGESEVFAGDVGNAPVILRVEEGVERSTAEEVVHAVPGLVLRAEYSCPPSQWHQQIVEQL